ncbi:MAG: hypothetical protein ACXWPM_13410 [Bdellovibrionota bacterium]
MRGFKAAVGFIGLAVILTACATAFTGSAAVDDGPRGCTRKCSSWNMELAGMVQMGEYSNGCICKVRGAAGKASIEDEFLASAAEPAAAGVMMQMERQRQQAANGLH